MKVAERGGRLTAISKTITKADALGSSIDVYRFSAEAGDAFFRACKEFIEVKRERNLWSEVALNAILPEVRFTACPLQGRWVEIDNHEDLAYANRLFSNDISEVTA
jgi:choline kinase